MTALLEYFKYMIMPCMVRVVIDVAFYQYQRWGQLLLYVVIALSSMTLSLGPECVHCFQSLSLPCTRHCTSS